MSTATALIADRVRERVRREGIDLGGDHVLARGYVREEVQRYSERALGGSLPMIRDEEQTTDDVLASIVGYGPLQRLFDDESVEEIWINGPNGVSVFDNEPFPTGQIRRISKYESQNTSTRSALCSCLR